MMKKWLACLLLAAFLLTGAAAWAQPAIPPAPTSGSLFVRDYAGVLSEDAKTRINFLGSQLKGKTTAHVVAVVVKSTDGATPEDYALAILREWGVGDKAKNNGVVILVAVNDRASRIEVGYGLEGRLPDAKTGRIQDEYMLPYFQRGDYDRGIYNGYLAVVQEAAQEYGVTIDGDKKKTVSRPQRAGEAPWWDSLPWWGKILLLAGALGLFILDWVFFGGQFTWLILALLMRRGGGGGGGGGFGGGSGGGGGSSRRW
ncbi:TPM domain-containing protein [Anaeroselena agilis]|uniref:TPM domain-containing protein n=1 Tax=Anaeroselena agilis TaxID=3063788 RepID=A0ABU3P072_9FIRM|nr:TPM domain-containing protein [Selenomonadales bacterium 4137-cl]